MPFRCFSGHPLHTPGVSNGRLANCPARPNCVCSDANDPQHGIGALILIVPSDVAWAAARETVRKLPRTRIVSESNDFLHAECRSAMFGFVDDLELHLRRESNSIAVRSASRLGHSDFGVNRKRVERLRGTLATQGIAKNNT